MPALAQAQVAANNDEREIDDLDRYITTFSHVERRELAAAETAIDLAMLLNRARQQRGLSQAAAARLSGLKQQAISRLDQPGANPRIETVQTYLGALGYALEPKAVDQQPGGTASTECKPVPSPGGYMLMGPGILDFR